MIYTAENLPVVDPMDIRRITPEHEPLVFGGVILMSHYSAKPIRRTTQRLVFDENVVDCSNRMFEITNFLMFTAKKAGWWTIFHSRRWRSGRIGDEIIIVPGKDVPFMYIGNPIRLHVDGDGGITVFRTPEFLIKSGCALGY